MGMRRSAAARCYCGAVPQLERITVHPDVMGGKPCIRGMRVVVGMMVEALAAGRSVRDLLADFPYLGSFRSRTDAAARGCEPDRQVGSALT